MNERLRALMKRREDLIAQAKAIEPEEGAEDLTEEQYEAKADLISQIEALDPKIETERKAVEYERNAPAIPDVPVTVKDRREDDPKAGFAHIGEFANAVKQACSKVNPQTDERLFIAAGAPTTSGSLASGEDGGFTVPPEFREEIMRVVSSEESLFSRTDQISIQRSSIKMPVDETTDWQTSGGILTAWEDELGVLTQSKPQFREVEWNARKITSLVPVSNELLEDSSAMDGYIRRRAPEKISFAIDLAIFRGNGVGRPLGFLNSGALISVSKESGQAADTVVRENIDNMWMRMPITNRRNAVWIINQDIEAQLQSLSFTGTESPVPVYLPAGGYSGQPFDTLKGRPVIYHQAASTLGDKGDIALTDLNQYVTVVKQNSPRVDTSMHLYFDADATAFRFIMRVGGHPWLSSPIDPRAGSNTLSPFVTLDERA